MTDSPAFKSRATKLKALRAVRQGNIDEGIELYRSYLGEPGNERDDDAWAGLGGAWRRKGNTTEAINGYQQAFVLNPSSTYAAVNLVSLEAARGDQSETFHEHLKAARELVESIINESKEEASPDHWTWFDLATLQLIGGDRNARSNFEFAAKMKSCAPAHVDSALSNLRFLAEHNETLRPAVAEIAALLKPYSAQHTR